MNCDQMATSNGHVTIWLAMTFWVTIAIYIFNDHYKQECARNAGMCSVLTKRVTRDT